MFILDSSAIIEIAHNSELGRKIVDKVGDEKVCITSLSVNELFFSEKETKKMEDFIKNVHVFSFDKEAARLSAKIEKELKKSGKMINKSDIFIAAICIQTNSTLITCDNDFKKISGLDAVFF